MIFKQEMVDKVLAGEKTVTRRPVKLEDGGYGGAIYLPCRYKVGRTYAVQPGRGKKAVGRIRVLDVRREQSFGSVRAEWGGLRREGFESYAEFESYLRRLYGGEVPSGPVDRIEFELRQPSPTTEGSAAAAPEVKEGAR